MQRREPIGSGPAGLACAQQLARAGHRVTVYERDAEIGGLLRYGIPDFRLEKWVLDRRLAQMREEGVRFVTEVQVGEDPDAVELLEDRPVMVIACGLTTPRDVRVPGRSLEGIHFALDFLIRQNRRVNPVRQRAEADPQIDARGLDVVVIGGGDTGSDCVGTAIRQGARSVTQIQYHAAPPHQGDLLLHWPEPVPELVTERSRHGGQPPTLGLGYAGLRGGSPSYRGRDPATAALVARWAGSLATPPGLGGAWAAAGPALPTASIGVRTSSMPRHR